MRPGLYFDILVMFALGLVSAGGATYYVDASGGSDANSGTTSNAAWRTIAKVSAMTFQPGDLILFKAGEAWSGELRLNGNGTAGAPIVVDQYGEGGKPFIDGNGYESAVRLQGVSYWQVNNLEIVNNGGPTLSGPVDYRAGVLVRSAFSVIRRHIHLRNLVVHHIFPEAGSYGHGIHVIAQGSSSVDTYYDDVRIENCHISLTGRFGVWVQHTGSANSNPGFKHNRNIVIRNNTFVNTGGSGAQTGWCDGVLVERNVVHASGASIDPRQWARGSGYWPWKCNNVLVQFNEFRHARGEADSAGVHIDYGSRDVTVQYNLSLDNEGGFVEILGDCVNAIYRYNISINDGARIKGVNGASQDGHLIWVSNYNGENAPVVGSINSRIYNNTIYVRPGITNYLKIMAGSEQTYIQNNLFYISGRAVYTNAGTSTIFENNLWHGNVPAGVPVSLSDVLANPLLANPGGTNALDYLLSPVSPAIARGREISDNGGLDYWGSPIPASAPCIGAVERAFSDAGVISLNFTTLTSSSQHVSGEAAYGIPAHNSRTTGWTNLYRTFDVANAPFNDGFPSTVKVAGSATGGWATGNAAYEGTPLLAGAANYTNSAVPTTVTLTNLTSSFPGGYKLIVYLGGFIANTGASITDGATTYYFRPLTNPVAPVHLVRTLATSHPAPGAYPFAQYAVFGAPVLLTNDSVTLSLKALSGGGVILGGLQIRSQGEFTPGGIPYGWFDAHGILPDDDADDDLDGVPAWKEFAAGTNPSDAFSFHRILSLRHTEAGLALAWLGGVTGYEGNWSMAVSTNLVDWSTLEFETIPRNPGGTNTWIYPNMTGSDGARFFRPYVTFSLEGAPVPGY